MRSAILSEQLKEKQEQKRQKHRRRMNRLYNRAYRKRQKLQKRQEEAAVPKHPTLSNEEIAAVEEAAAFDSGRQNSQTAKLESATTMDAGKKPAPNCLATLEEFEQRTTAQLKELQVLKHGPPEPEPKLRIPPPFDMPNGIII